MTGSGYKHAQQCAFTAHTQPAIRPAPLLGVRSAAVYTSESVYSARPPVCSGSVAFPRPPVQPRTPIGVIQQGFGLGAGASVHLQLRLVRRVKSLKHMTTCHLEDSSSKDMHARTGCDTSTLLFKPTSYSTQRGLLKNEDSRSSRFPKSISLTDRTNLNENRPW